jgi:hypothetical protein
MLDEAKQREAFDVFARFMQVHLFGLVAVIDRPSEGERFPIASGFITEIEGLCVLITVAHYLEDVKRWRDEKRLMGLFLLVHNEARICTPISINLDVVLGSFCNDFDVGFLILDDATVLDINKNGGAPMNVGSPNAKPEDFESFYLVGHASAYCKLETQTIATSQEANKRTDWKLSRPSDIASLVSKLEFERMGDKRGTFRFSLVQGYDDYSGSSGGPIIAYKTGAKVIDYCLFGIQSKQVLSATSQQKPTHVIATSAALGIGVIELYIRELSQANGRADS